MLATVLKAITRLLPRKVIPSPEGHKYLTRFRLFDRSRDEPGLWLHRFHRGDGDRELHNHPMDCYCLMLVNGYEEESLAYVPLYTNYNAEGRVWHRQYGMSTQTKLFPPGSVNKIKEDLFHRVHLINGQEAWTLVLRMPYVRKWGFLDWKTGLFTDWKAFLRARGSVIPEEADSIPWDPAEVQLKSFHDLKVYLTETDHDFGAALETWLNHH